MESIRKRDNKYQVQIRRKYFPTKSKTFHKKSDALEWTRYMEAKADRGGLPDGTRPTHVDFKDICVTDYLLNASQNNDIGNYYALEHGLTWTDM